METNRQVRFYKYHENNENNILLFIVSLSLNFQLVNNTFILEHKEIHFVSIGRHKQYWTECTRKEIESRTLKLIPEYRNSFCTTIDIELSALNMKLKLKLIDPMSRRLSVFSLVDVSLSAPNCFT